MKTKWIKPPYYTTNEDRIVYETNLIRMQRLVDGRWITVLTQNYPRKLPAGVTTIGSA
jgi:hypothetical protein